VAQLIEDLLDVSRIITGKIRLSMRTVELAPVIEAAVAAVQPAAAAKSIDIDLTLPPAVAPVRGDIDRLQQVVWNLLSNAIKFTPDKGRVSVRLDHGPGGVRIVVRDTGQGISPGVLPYVFDRFAQGDGGPRAGAGLGLGLAIARHIVELHGGEIRAESEGEGQPPSPSRCRGRPRTRRPPTRRERRARPSCRACASSSSTTSRARASGASSPSDTTAPT
jgi:signal transduction histidine kinase